MNGGGLALPALAVLAGALSFSSPCTLPLVPGYLSYMSGVSASRGRALGAAGLFVLGFAIVFTALGAVASSLGQILLTHRVLLERLAGAVIILLGAVLVGGAHVPVLMREKRPLLARVRPGPEGALFLGIAFGFGWTPCIGPVLGSILLLAGSQRTLASGAALLMLYSLGLGLPFLAAAAFMDRSRRVGGWLARRSRLVDPAAGALLVVMGILVLTGRLQPLLAPALDAYARLRWPPL